MTASVVAMPVLILLLFNYAFGGALGARIGGMSGGITGGGGSGDRYIDYVAPGIILMAATSGSLVTAVGICVDMTEGIVRPDATPVEWLAVVGLLALVTLALTWVSAAIGLMAKTPESASNIPLPLQFLPFMGSAIVPTTAGGYLWARTAYQRSARR
ncbi:hypothetical protein [Streptomyces sp. NEAU-174]|uniref:hypothetical protein n=1 Tax=Streptomyces sp. NEAU-174 TaxID=3458254 RepID=UPI0040443648